MCSGNPTALGDSHSMYAVNLGWVQGVLGRKDVMQGSRRKVCKINFEKSKSKKPKSEKVPLKYFKIVNFEKSKSRKVYFLTFHFLTVWFFAGCLSRWTCTAKSTKLTGGESRGEKKNRKVEKSKGGGKQKSRKVEKSKSILFWFFTFWLFEFLPDAFPAEHAQLKVQNFNRWESRGKKKSRTAKKSRGKKKSRKVEKYTFWFFTFWLSEFLPDAKFPAEHGQFFFPA